MINAEAVRQALVKLKAERDARPQEEKDRETKQLAEYTREGTTPAPDGQVYVCGACGKTSTTRYGRGATNGWDESCMLHAVLCHVEKMDGKWQAVQRQGKAEKDK